MKKFETPELEILKFSVMDVIASSLVIPEDGEDMGDWA